MTYPKAYLQELKRYYGMSLGELIVLAPQNDPFNTGSATQIEQAQWFADLWQRFGYRSGVHLRRVHYRLTSPAERPKMHNGEPYDNTERCWDYLNQAGKYARYLGLVSADAFDDRRNPDPMIFVSERETQPEPLAVIGDVWWDLPTINTYALEVNLPVPTVFVDGYDYMSADQPYHLRWQRASGSM